jgi:hypothetical protein
MQLMYVARMARPDLLVAITRLASQIHRWTQESDRRIKRLFDRLDGHCGSSLSGSLKAADRDVVEIWAWPDADLAGNKDSSKSTSGRYIELASPNGGSMPLAWGSNQQGGTSHSTPEAETVSLSDCMRRDAIPLQDLMSTLLGRTVKCRVFEDNEATIKIVEKGYSGALRYLRRTQRTDIGQLHELFYPVDEEDTEMFESNTPFSIEYVNTKLHKGDQFTKELSAADFTHAKGMIHMRSYGG